MHTAPDLLPIGEAARRLNRTVDTLRRWERTGRLTPVRLHGSKVRHYRIADVEAVIAARSEEPAA